MSEGIDVDKTNTPKECDICHYWYFKIFVLFIHIFEPYLWNGCHNLMQKSMNFGDVAIVSVKGSDYRIYFYYISSYYATNIMKIFNLDEKGGLL